MSYLIDVIITWPLWGALTYECEIIPESGSRVLVPVGNKNRVGFVKGLSDKNLIDFKIKPVKNIIDSRRVIDSDLWDMALWAGKICMCGEGSALNLILPKKFIDGEIITPSKIYRDESKNFHEISCFNPFDSARNDFYLSELEKSGRALMLLPTHERAANFFANLPDSLKSQAILWPSGNRIWQAWQLVHMKNFRIVVAAPGGIFAPLSPDKIIIEDESNPAYIIPYALNISARSLAGRRAYFNHGELITGGAVPSLKTFKRLKPEQIIKPDRKNIIIVDINYSHKGQEKGIDGNIPLTFSLIKRTYKELINKRNVIWILNRLGESSEVFCDNCGESVKCPKCNNIMRSEEDGQILKCRVCGHVREVPEKCESCGFEILRGKRPGIDALAKMIEPYYKDIQIYGDKSKKISRKKFQGLILSTQRGLELCGKINPGLVAWLDIDSELYRQDYDTRFNLFRLLYESYFRGREINSARKILVQTRKSGSFFASQISGGFRKFLEYELNAREEYNLPPYGCVVEIDCCGVKSMREKIINILESANFFVMDPGEDNLPLVVNTNSLEKLSKILEPFCTAGHKNKIKPNITIRSE